LSPTIRSAEPVGRYQPVVSRDDLQGNAEIFQLADGVDDIGLWRIKKEQGIQEGQACLSSSLRMNERDPTFL